MKSVTINVDSDVKENESKSYDDDDEICIHDVDDVDEEKNTVIDFPMKKTEILNAKKTKININSDEEDELNIIDPEIHHNDKDFIIQKYNYYDSEYNYNFLVCCWNRPIMKLAVLVSYISSVSFMANLISLIAVGSHTALHFALEAIILIIEFFCLLLLYYSISHNTSKFMKPYMVFGAIWNIFLVLLWLICLAELIKGEQFSFKVSSSLSQIFLPSKRHNYYNYNNNTNSYKKNEYLTAILMLLGLGATIIVNFWLLHIIVLAYFYLKQRNLSKHKQTQSTPPSTPIYV